MINLQFLIMVLKVMFFFFFFWGEEKFFSDIYFFFFFIAMVCLWYLAYNINNNSKSISKSNSKTSVLIYWQKYEKIKKVLSLLAIFYLDQRSLIFLREKENSASRKTRLSQDFSQGFERINTRIQTYGKIIEGALSNYVTFLYSKVRSPPYCCTVPLDQNFVRGFLNFSEIATVYQSIFYFVTFLTSGKQFLRGFL